MLPSDPRSPHLQNRAVELFNVSGEAVPAYAVCQVVDADRPERGTTQTPGGGRTRLRITKPDSRCSTTVINGQVPMSYTGDGQSQVGFLDLTYALYDPGDGTPMPGEAWGAGVGSWKLRKGQTGWVVVGDAHTTACGAYIVRVMRTPPEATFFATLTACLHPGQTATATIAGASVTVRDPHKWNFGIVGEVLAVEGCGGQYRVIGSHGLTRRIESTSSSPVECLDTGTAKVLGDANSPPCEIEYVNDSCDPIEEGRTGFAMYNRTTSTWYATFRQKPRFAIATLTSPLCPDDAVAAVEGAEAVDCSTCGTFTISSPIASTWGAAGEEGDAVFAFRKDDGTWDVLTAVHKSFTPLVDLENGATCGEAGGKTRQISAMFCTTDEEDVALALGETVVVEFSSRFDSECNFQVRTIELCVLGASNPSEWFTKKTAQEVTVVDTLSVSTSTSEMLVGTSKVRVLCAGPGDDYPLDLCVYCDPPPPPPSSSSPDTECEICGENDVPHTISLSISFSGSLDGYTLEATATWDEGAEEWQLPGDDTLLLDGVPNSSYLVQGQFVCVDDVLTLALTIASEEEDCTHVYEFSFASPSVSSGTLTASATEEVVDCPVCPGTAGQPNGTEVERVVADQLQIHFDAWAENMSFQVALYRCDGEYLRSSACGGVEAGATMQETNSTPPFLDGAGDDWYVVIKWYSGDTCATTVRTDVVLSPTATTCEQPGTCEITVDIEADVSDCEAPPSSSSGGGDCVCGESLSSTGSLTISAPGLPGGELELTWNETDDRWESDPFNLTCATDCNPWRLTLFCVVPPETGILELWCRILPSNAAGSIDWYGIIPTSWGPNFEATFGPGEFKANSASPGAPLSCSPASCIEGDTFTVTGTNNCTSMRG